MCNGPSLNEVNIPSLFEHDVIGMNGAYRFYQKENCWPKYFGCFDTRVTENHEKNFLTLINTSPIERLFLLKRISLSPKLTTLKLHGSIGDFSTKFETFGYGGNTGANCCQVGICLGYKKIILLGADCNYIEVVNGAKVDGNALVMESTPASNPNYFFNHYQQKGDEYNYPQADRFHIPAWKALSNFAHKIGVDIVNCSQGSKLECFRRSRLKYELK